MKPCLKISFSITNAKNAYNFMLLCIFVFTIGCKERKHPTTASQTLTATALDYYLKGSYDSAIYTWDKAFKVFKQKNQWDSIIDWSEKYIISNSRIYRIEPAHQFLNELESHYKNQSIVDSILLSKIWVRRSELLYVSGLPIVSRDTLLAALELRKRLLGNEHPLIGDAYDYLNIAEANIGNYWNAAYYGESGISVYKQCRRKGLIDESSNLPWVIGNTGECYNALGDYDKAISYLQEAFDSLQKANAPSESKAYYQLLIASCFRKKGDYRNALELLQTSEDSVKKTDIKNYLAEIYGEIALCYKDIGFKTQMMDYAQRQYDIYKEIHKGRNHTELVQSSMLLGECCIYADKEIIANIYLDKALQLLRNLGDTSVLLFSDIYSLQGTRFLKMKLYDSAAVALNKALKLKQQTLGFDNDQTALVLLEQAKLYHEKGDYKQSSKLAKNALTIFLKQRSGQHPYVLQCAYYIAYQLFTDNKKQQALLLVESKTNPLTSVNQSRFISRSHLQLLTLKTEILAPQNNDNDSSHWEKCLQSYLDLSNAYQEFLGNVLLEGSHFAQAEEIINTIKNGVAACHKLYTLTNNKKYIQTAFDLAELTRAQSIRLSLQHYNANKFAGVPDSIIRKEELIRINKAQLEKLVLNATSSEIPDSIAIGWKKQLLQLQREYAIFSQKIGKEYPAYYKLKLNTETTNIEQLKQYAKQNQTAIISYTATNDNIYAIEIDADNLKFASLKIHPDSLTDLVTTYRLSLIKSDASSFAQVGSLLYNKLLSPLLLKANQIIIIPDEAICYLSFESLLSKEPTAQTKYFQKLHYAIYDRNWKYSFNAALLLKEQTIEKNTSNWIAIAPGFENEKDKTLEKDSLYSTLLQQPWAKQLATDLRKQYSASTYTGFTATETRYNHTAASANVIYIGTHAFPDDEDPMHSMLVFSKTEDENDGYLHAYEIYRSPLEASMVVLGGCATGYGSIRSGEGVISLASAFTYAGCNSLVVSLWSIDDQQTSNVLRSFFDNTQNKLTASLSLTNAKKQYLSETHKDALYNPLYWSGLVLVGNDVTIAGAGNASNIGEIVFWGLIVCSAIAIFIILIYKRQKALNQ